MRKWTISLTAVALLSLNGCALPPVVTVASYAVDIVTYEATGKTATDHVYSAVARSDCSFVRVLHQKPICVDPVPAADAAVAAQTPQAHDAEQEVAGIASASAPQNQNVKVVIGSFLDSANAERSIARYADWHPVVINVTVGGRHFHRVVAGSLSNDAAAALKEKIAADQAGLRFAQSSASTLGAGNTIGKASPPAGRQRRV
jgi:hypothetical protein